MVAGGNRLDPGGQKCGQDDSYRDGGPWVRSCQGRFCSKPFPSPRQRHWPYSSFHRTRREAAGAAQRSCSKTCPCRVLSSGHSAQCIEVKEVLPVAARAMGLTIQTWEVRAADSFEKVFAALNEQRRMDSTWPGSALMIANRKRIVGFVLKSRLSSVYGGGEAVDAGGLLSYGADLSDSYRRVAYYVNRLLKGPSLPISLWSSRRSLSWCSI